MNVFLTGATGFLGGEILVNLAKRQEINKIYCFVRALDEANAYLRLEHIFNLHNDYFDKNRIIPVIGDLFDKDLTSKLIGNMYIRDTNVIIHSAANTSFSKIYNKIIEQTNVYGLLDIIQWAEKLESLNTFLYIGTATICGKNVTNRLVFEDESPNFKASHLVKYTYTKMIGEVFLSACLPAEKILIVRPSIIMGDSRPIEPRSPVILWALATLNLLRLVPVNPQIKLDIISVDYAAEAIIKLLFAQKKYKTYHISSGEDSATTPYKVLNAIEPYFNHRPVFHFVQKMMLVQMKRWTKNNLKPESDLYAYKEYIHYWKKTFQDPGKLRIVFAGLEPYLDFMELGQVFDNTRLLEDTTIEKPIPADIYIKNAIPFLEKIDVFDGAIDP